MKTSTLLLALLTAMFAGAEVTTDASGNKTIDVQTGSETLDVYLNGNFKVTKTGAGTAILGLKKTISTSAERSRSGRGPLARPAASHSVSRPQSQWRVEQPC